MFNTEPTFFSNNTNSIPSISYEPRFALVFHSVERETVVTKHIVKNGLLQSGTVVEPIDIIQATIDVKKNNLNYANSKSQIISERVLLDDHKTLIWHSKASNRTMWFSGQECGKARLRLWWPNLLFVVNKKNNSMSVFATATSARPNEKTRLYQAPLMNISENGSICLGSAKLPKDLSQHNIVAMENCIYDSNFSHLNFKNDDQEHMKNDKCHIKFYRSREKSQQKFKASEMTFLCHLSKII